MELGEILNLMVERGASDLQLRAPNPPMLRIGGHLSVQEDLPPVTSTDLETVLEDITTPEQRDILLNETGLDLMINVSGLARFQVRALYQRGSVSLAFRLVPLEIMALDELELLLNPTGLILVTGPGDNGKTTMVAGMILNFN